MAKKHKKKMTKVIKYAMRQRREKKMYANVQTAGHFSYLSAHALKRLKQRTQTTVSELTHLLDNGGVVNLGSHPGKNLQSLVFFSPKDNCCFVAIQDNNVGKIITIWLLEYHKRLAWEIKAEECEEAKQLYDKYQQQQQSIAIAHKKQSKQTPPSPKPEKIVEAMVKKPKFILIINYIDKDFRHKRRVVLEVRAEKYNHEIKQLWQDDGALAKIDKNIERKNILQQSIFLLEILNQDRKLLDFITFREREEAYTFMHFYLKAREKMYQLLFRYDFNQEKRSYLPKWQSLPQLTWQQTVVKEQPQTHKTMWLSVILVMILLGLLIKYWQKIKHTLTFIIKFKK